MNECKNPAVQDAKRDEALFTVVKPIVFQGNSLTIENALGIHKIKTMLPEVLCPFVFIPSHPHLKIVVTLRNYVK